MSGGKLDLVPADDETVCSCLGVTRATILQAIHDQGITTMLQIKQHTRASTGCGSCAFACFQLLQTTLP